MMHTLEDRHREWLGVTGPRLVFDDEEELQEEEAQLQQEESKLEVSF